MIDGETKPPPLLTEADLIGLMEKHGIGKEKLKSIYKWFCLIIQISGEVQRTVVGDCHCCLHWGNSKMLIYPSLKKNKIIFIQRTEKNGKKIVSVVTKVISWPNDSFTSHIFTWVEGKVNWCLLSFLLQAQMPLMLSI